MNVYYATFHGLYIGGDAVVRANDEEDARTMLYSKMAEELEQGAKLDRARATIGVTLVQDEPGVYCFSNGDY